MPFAQSGPYEIYFELRGSGSPLLLSAGQGTGPQSREPLIAGLAQHHSVLIYDQRGTGRSSPAEQGHSIEALAQDVLALMDTVQWPVADVVGLSTGTGMATAFASEQPTRVSHLVLAAPWTHGSREFRWLQELRKSAARCLSPTLYSQFNQLLLYSPDYRRDNYERLEQLVSDAQNRPHDAIGIAGRLDAILAFDARPHYARIQCPTLILGALDDQIMPIWFAQDAAGMVAGAKLVELTHGGHMFPETRTEEFLAAVLPFLKH